VANAFGWGFWHLQAQATYMLRSRVQSAPGQAYASDLGQFDFTTLNVTPRWRSRIVTGLTRPDWSLNVVMNHTSGYHDLPLNPTNLDTGAVESVNKVVSPFTTWDLVFQSGWLTGMDLRLNIRNLFNHQAPLSFATIAQQLGGANTVYSNLWGRVVELGLTARF